MPLYVFESESGAITDLFYKMADVPSVGAQIIDENGVTWRRIFTRPNAAISTQTDPYSSSDFNKSLDGKKVTIGDMFDASKEQSERRAAKDGKDPIKQEWLKNYSNTRNGQEHSIVKQEKFAEKQKEIGIKIKNAFL